MTLSDEGGRRLTDGRAGDVKSQAHWWQTGPSTRSMLTLTRRLLSMRRMHPVLARGGLRLVEDTPDGTLVFERESEAGLVLVALNLTDRPRQLSMPQAGKVLIGTFAHTDGKALGRMLKLRPNEGVVIESASTR